MSVKNFSCRQCTYASEPFTRNSGEMAIECRLTAPDHESGFPIVSPDGWCGEFLYDTDLIGQSRDPSCQQPPRERDHSGAGE